MTWVVAILLFPALGYLAGSVPFGYLIGRINGIDIRQHGSRNVGATNVSRVLGRRWGFTVFALDVIKGVLPVAGCGFWLSWTVGMDNAGPGLYTVWFLTAFTAVAGHLWPVWLGFHGGKGVATSLGVLLGLYPFFTWPGLIALAAWVVVTLTSRYVSVGSIVAVGGFPIIMLAMSLALGGRWSLARIWPLLLFSSLMALLVIWRHRANVRRLWAGTELKIGQRSS